MTHLPPHRSSLLSAGVVLTIALLATGSASVRAQDAARGAALLALAQQAIGGKGLAAVKTLQITGTFRRVVEGNDTEGDFDVFIELPDKYLRSEKTGTPGQPSTESIEALVGGVSRDAVRGGRGSGPPRGTPDGDAAGPVDATDDATGQREGARDGGSGDTPPVDAGANPEATTGRGRGGFAVDPDAQRRARQGEVSRLLLMWLLRSDNTPLIWVGVAQSPDGTADVLEARYADGQPTRLFLESKSHMPLMLQWTAAPGAGPGGRRGGGGRRGAIPNGATPPQGGAPQAVTFNMTFSDHRTVNGIRLPHVITRGSNGQTTEQWTVSRYRVNPTFDAGTFTR